MFVQIARDSKDRLFTWGFGGYGRLGHQQPKDELIPRLVSFFKSKSEFQLFNVCCVMSSEARLFYTLLLLTACAFTDKAKNGSMGWAGGGGGLAGVVGEAVLYGTRISNFELE